MTNLSIKEKRDLFEVYGVIENRDFTTLLNRVFSIKKSYFMKLFMRLKGRNAL